MLDHSESLREEKKFHGKREKEGKGKIGNLTKTTKPSPNAKTGLTPEEEPLAQAASKEELTCHRGMGSNMRMNIESIQCVTESEENRTLGKGNITPQAWDQKCE